MKLRLHHIGIVVKNIDKSIIEYTPLGYEKLGEIVHDPIQTAYVQFMGLRNDEAQVELISPDGPGSKLAQALKKGGGLNHLCYQTGDINDTCKQLRKQGFFLLHSPVEAVALNNRRIAWLMGRNGIPIELVEVKE